jgi:hypothetical protein
MDQNKAKTSLDSRDAPGVKLGDFAELLVAGIQDLLGASEDDARRWRERVVESPRPRDGSGAPAALSRSTRV